ncbi:MAG: hypothetical protein K6F15_05110 [Treponema sp.]|nr:hypothetical protein [Treponema sp.]
MKKFIWALYAFILIALTACSNLENNNSAEKAFLLQNLISQNEASSENTSIKLDISRSIIPESFSQALKTADLNSVDWDMDFTVSSSNEYEDARDFNITGRKAAEAVLSLNSVKKGIYDIYVTGDVSDTLSLYGSAKSIDFSKLTENLPIMLYPKVVSGNGSVELYVQFTSGNGWILSDSIAASSFEAKLFPVTDDISLFSEEISTEGIKLDPSLSYDDEGNLNLTLTASEIPACYYVLEITWNNYALDSDGTSIIDIASVIHDDLLIFVNGNMETSNEDEPIMAYYAEPDNVIQSTYYAKDDPNCAGSGRYSLTPAYIWDLLDLLYSNFEKLSTNEAQEIYIFCDDFAFDVAKYNELTADKTFDFTTKIYIYSTSGLVTISSTCSTESEVTSNTFNVEADSTIYLKNSSDEEVTLSNLDIDSNFSPVIHELYLKDDKINVFLTKTTNSNLKVYFRNPEDYLNKSFISCSYDMYEGLPTIYIYDEEKDSYYLTSNYAFTATAAEDGSYYKFTLNCSSGSFNLYQSDFEIYAYYEDDSNSKVSSLNPKISLCDDNLIFEADTGTLNLSNTNPFVWKLNGSFVKKGSENKFSFNPTTTGLGKYCSAVIECDVTLSNEQILSKSFELSFGEDLCEKSLDDVYIYLDETTNILKLYNPDGNDINLLGNVSDYWLPGDDYIYVCYDSITGISSRLGVYKLLENNTLKNYPISSAVTEKIGTNTIYDVARDSYTNFKYLLYCENTTYNIVQVANFFDDDDTLIPEGYSYTNLAVQTMDVIDNKVIVYCSGYSTSREVTIHFEWDGANNGSFDPTFSITSSTEADLKLNDICYTNGAFYATVGFEDESKYSYSGTVLKIVPDFNANTATITDLFSSTGWQNSTNTWRYSSVTNCTAYIPDSQSDCNQNSFYSPYKIYAIKEKELYIYDYGLYQPSKNNYGELNYLHRCVKFNLNDPSIKTEFAGMPLKSVSSSLSGWNILK